MALDLSDSKLEIGEKAFYNCKNLETVTFKEVHEWYATEEDDSKEKVKTATLSTINFSADNDFNKYYWHRVD